MIIIENSGDMPAAEDFLSRIKQRHRERNPGWEEAERTAAEKKRIADADWLENRGMIIPEMRNAFLSVAPEILAPEIKTADDSFWRSLYFKSPNDNYDETIVGMLREYALENGCYLVASSTPEPLYKLPDGTITFSNGGGDGRWYSTPGQIAKLRERLDEVVGSGSFLISDNDGRVPLGAEDDDCDIAIAVPLTFAAAKAMRNLQLAGEFRGQ